MAEAKALLASPTSLTQAIVTLASNDTQDGENGDGAEDGEGGADGEQDGENANS